jgi:hypothetical protein
MPNEPENIVTPGKPEPSGPEPDQDSLESSDVSASAGKAASNAPVPGEPKKLGLIARLRSSTNIYLVVFILLILVSAAGIYVTVRSSHNTPKTTGTGSLTDQQLAALKGNTTLVGDAKQTLDVQSNAIFEGQVLLRSDLNVAGAIKVGGGLSLSSITVGGAASFGQLAVNGGLNVGGDTTLQGQLTVQKNLSVGGAASFGSLSVSQLAVTSLQLKGDLTLSKHITTSGGNPGRNNGTALGSGGTASVSGSDTAGTVTINTGGGPPAGCFITVNFSQKYSSTPHVVISPSNSSAATIQYYVNRSTTGFSVCSANAPAAASNYTYDYVVVD